MLSTSSPSIRNLVKEFYDMAINITVKLLSSLLLSFFA